MPTKNPAVLAAGRKRENTRRKERMRTDPEFAARRRAIEKTSHHGAAHVPQGQQIKSVSLLTNEQTGELDASWTKTEHAADPAKIVTPPPGFTIRNMATMTVAGEPRVQWISHDQAKADQWQGMLTACREAMAEYRGVAAAVPPPDVTEDRLMNVIPIGDPHIGMLSWTRETGQDFDSSIARRDLTKAMQMVINRSPAADHILIAQLGDFFHAEDDKQVTPTAGHKLDVDTRAGRITKLGYHLMRGIVDMALLKHKRVSVVNLRGNHDPYKSIALNLWLEAIYENEPRVTIIDNNDPFIFVEHGTNLFGFHHGDGAKPESLPGIMATWREGAPWGRARHRRWFTGHIHNFQGRDLAGCVWESYQTLAPADYWTHWKGYRSGQSLQCLSFDDEDGLVSRQVVSLKMVRPEGV